METGASERHVGAGRDRDRALHERLLRRDPTAPSELAERCLAPLVDALRRSFVSSVDQVMLEDAAIEMILKLGERPEKYDPERGSLASYLRMAARRDVLNDLESERRRNRHLAPLEDVELRSSARNLPWASTRDPAEALVDKLGHERVGRLREQFEGSELEMVDLLVDGERRTEVYADVLGLRDLPWEEQVREVKRAKDRLKKRMKRLWLGMADDA